MAVIAAAVAQFPPKIRNFRHNSVFLEMSDLELRERYRFGSDGIRFIHDLLKDRLVRQGNQRHTISSLEQVLLALRYYASGSFMQAIGDTVGRDKASVSRAVTSVTDALCEVRDDFITWPTEADRKAEIKHSFYQLSRFPNVIGCVDGTHIRIQKPAAAVERQFFNRKHFPSINVMCVCDHKGRFTHVNAKWPGSSHDSFVFRSSSLSTHLEANHRRLEEGIILGDSGYACTRYLMTPHRVVDRPSRQRFNTAHSRARVSIEMAFGRWKRRFGILHGEMRLKPLKASRVAIACAVLHNIAILLNEPEIDNQVQGQPQPVNVYNGPEDGRVIRDHITNTYF